MFLLNYYDVIEDIVNLDFTIQNVPIKSKATKNRIPASRTFTIQNVPIK